MENFPGPLMSERKDMGADIGYANNVVGFRPGQVGNCGILKNPRPQTPMHGWGHSLRANAVPWSSGSVTKK